MQSTSIQDPLLQISFLPQSELELHSSDAASAVGEGVIADGLGDGEGLGEGLAGPTFTSNVLEVSFPEESVATIIICCAPCSAGVNFHPAEHVFCRLQSKVPELDPESGFVDAHVNCFIPLSSSAVIFTSNASPKAGFEGFRLVEEIKGGLLYSSAAGSCAACGLGSVFAVDFKLGDRELWLVMEGDFSGVAISLVFPVLSVAHPLIKRTAHNKIIKISFISYYIWPNHYLKSILEFLGDTPQHLNRPQSKPPQLFLKPILSSRHF